MEAFSEEVVSHKVCNTNIIVFPPKLDYQERMCRIRYLENIISGLLNCEVNLANKDSKQNKK